MKPALERFFSKVVKAGDCWFWLGAKNQGGYGKFSENYIKYVAHRWLYQFVNGPVDKKLDLDHLCRNRNCVNPEHLEPVTRSENSIRGIGPKLAAERQLVKTHCPKGHEYTEINTYFRKNKVNRICRICRKLKQQKRRVLNKHLQGDEDGL